MYQGDVDIVDDFGGPKVSGSSPDTAQVTWEKIGKPSDSKPVIKEGVPTIKAAGLTDEAIETWRKKNATSLSLERL